MLSLLNEKSDNPMGMQIFSAREVPEDTAAENEPMRGADVDLHRQEISVLHIACQENLILTATLIAKKYPLMMRQ